MIRAIFRVQLFPPLAGSKLIAKHFIQAVPAKGDTVQLEPDVGALLVQHVEWDFSQDIQWVTIWVR